MRVCAVGMFGMEFGNPHPVGPLPPSYSYIFYILIVNIHLDKDPRLKKWVGGTYFDPPP